MKTKICRDCKLEKQINEFRKNSRQCRKCEAIYKKEYYKKTKERKKEYSKNYRNENKDYYKKYREMHKRKMKKYNENYYIKNKKEIIKKNDNYKKTRIENDSLYKLKDKIRKMIYNSFYRLKYCKKHKTEQILGCDYETFITHLLQTYKNNYGYEWNNIEPVHIDHIKALKYATTEEEVIKLCHYTNLQLLKAHDNLEKSAKTNWELQK